MRYWQSLRQRNSCRVVKISKPLGGPAGIVRAGEPQIDEEGFRFVPAAAEKRDGIVDNLSTFVNPRRPNAGFTMTLAELFPEILAGTIDGIIKQGVHFAHAARVAGVAGAKNASTPEAWRDR